MRLDEFTERVAMASKGDQERLVRAMAPKRVARFKLSHLSGGRYDGKKRATVEIEQRRGSPNALFRVQPFRSKRTYTLPLSTVAEIVIAKVVKSEL